MMIIWIWLLVLVTALTLYLRRVYSRFSKYGVKHFTPLPFIGTMGRILLRLDHLTDSIERSYNFFPGERFIGGYTFLSPGLVVNDIELLKKITVKDFEHFLDHKSIMDDDLEPLFGRTLFLLKGQEWKDMRSTLSPAFTSSKIRMMVPFMVEVGEQMKKAIKEKIRVSGEDYADLDAKDLTSRYTNDVIASCAFGLKVDSHFDERNQFYTMNKKLTEVSFMQILKFLAFLIFPRLIKKLKWSMTPNEISTYYRKLVLNTMEDRKSRNIVRPDMIHLLMEAKKGQLSHDNKVDSDAGFATVQESDVGKKEIQREWSDDDLVAQAILFLAAGLETVSTAMSFLLYELAVNPDVQEKLLQEIRENDEKNDGKFDYSSIQAMKYMDMVVSEALRLWPPAPAMERLCVKEYNLGKPNENAPQDYIIHKGEGLGIPVWSIHRDPKYFPDPLKFDPERFSDQNKHQIKPFTYMPFGLGPRNCIGSRFALCEVKVMVYQLLRDMEVSPAAKTQVPAKIDKKSFNLQREGGDWIRFRIRNTSDDE